ncbi:glycyl-radical enzyme activating protein [Clostridium sp. Cult2]|uniref:glycyl-radical enzyme activating protein n=1 Tax=Clostridium sp. Cult2 TaxID=2079003 RepID=UPI001EFF6E38
MVSIEGKIFNIMKYSIHDGPGIRTTVFLKGCPLSCLWCHNPESQNINNNLMFFPNRCIGCRVCIEACTQNAIKEVKGMVITDKGKCIECGHCTLVCYAEAREMAGKTMTVNQVVYEIVKDKDFYEQSGGGVTFSGGEPLMQPKFLIELLKEMKKRGIHTTVDTSGFASKQIIEEVSRYTSLFLYDLKHMNPIKHQKYTGMSNYIILENLRFLSEMNKEIIIRIPIIPRVNDSEEDLKAFRDFIKTLPNVKEVNLLAYHNMGEEKYNRLGILYKMKGIEETSLEKLDFALNIINSCGANVKTGS